MAKANTFVNALLRSQVSFYSWHVHLTMYAPPHSEGQACGVLSRQQWMLMAASERGISLSHLCYKHSFCGISYTTLLIIIGNAYTQQGQRLNLIVYHKVASGLTHGITRLPLEPSAQIDVLNRNRVHLNFKSQNKKESIIFSVLTAFVLTSFSTTTSCFGLPLHGWSFQDCRQQSEQWRNWRTRGLHPHWMKELLGMNYDSKTMGNGQ